MTPRHLLLPLTPIYGAVVRSRRWFYDHGMLKQLHLHHPVISVGSLSAGGAGKTPVVLLLAQLLHQQGLEVRILTRGYGRSSRRIEHVDASGDAERFGDEPLLLARRAPWACVIVGGDRYQAGILSERNEAAGARAVYLLDDGFQHQKLARDVELLLVTMQDFKDVLLPAGNLREPFASLKRADFLVLRDDEPELPALLQTALRSTLPPVLLVHRELSVPIMSPVPARPLIFSGLARPHGFAAMLSGLGICTEHVRSFNDHHRYSTKDMETLVADARKGHADGFITTEKDAVKLSPEMLGELRRIGPVGIATLHATMRDETAAMENLMSRLVSFPR